MSQWRRHASELLPEFQHIIASKDINGPMMLWIELNDKFEDLCDEDSPNLELIRKVWKYAQWCLEHNSKDVATAVALAFCEHLIDSDKRIDLLPRIMTKSDFLGFKELLLYHNTNGDFDAAFEKFNQ